MPDFAAAAFLHLFPSPYIALVWPDGAELNEECARILEHASASGKPTGGPATGSLCSRVLPPPAPIVEPPKLRGGRHVEIRSR